MSIVTGSASPEQLQATARDHLWSHFTNLAAFQDHEIPVIASGEGCDVIDANGKRYVDGLSGLFASQLGYSYGEEIGEAAAAQMRELGYYPNWAQAHPRVVELAAELASLAPEGLNRSFFVSGGGEAVESAWKLARAYWTAKGERRFKVIARRYAYHGTTMGALSINGIPGLRAPWEPLVPGASHVWNTDRFHRPQEETEEEFTRFLLTDLEQALIQASPASVAMVIMEPVQNQGGSLLPPAGYWAGVRELCDRYDVLLCADEVITGFGRLGAWFGSDLYDIRPDIVTCAKGLASGYAPIGAVIASDKVAQPFRDGEGVFTHGFTYGGHPVSCAVALKSIEIMRRERVIEHVRDNQEALRSTLERLLELPIVGDVRGTGYFFTIELTKDRDTRATMTMPEREQLFRGYLAPALFEHGLICRAEERIAPLIQISPPLVAGQEEFDRITEILAEVLREAPKHLPS
ncbi:MAG TPA: aspartate aminotransferase family protein [Solirubrobacteraceae bacterium]|nr:aspartate aminotransferase family protein [Solirubrobacteraceae bacterium]